MHDRLTLLSPEVYVLKTDHIEDSGVVLAVTLVVHPEGHVNHVHIHLDAELAQTIGMQLLMVAAEVKPELVW